METSPAQQAIATGLWYVGIKNEHFFANKLYGTIYSNVVILQGSHWQDGTGFDFTIEIMDSIPGNEQQDLPPNGNYNYPLEKESIKVSYHGRTNNQYFDGIPQEGKITLCLDPIKKLYHGHLNIRFLINKESFNINSLFGIQIP
ncbi:hypothetical protein [Pseudomonas lini]|uniref:hypothetical protein n=1 Tax=Pseudomonas lini TaxID=163011 RepID=UPI00345E7F57